MKIITFKQKLKNTSAILMFFAFTFFGFTSINAQVQNNGNLYINNGGSFFVKGPFNFGTGSSTKTSRTDLTYGKLIFGASATSTGPLFADGFVSTRKSDFTLPTGEGTTYAPIGIANASVTSGVDAAYYSGTISGALDVSVAAVSTGYWVVKGDNPTVTIIWGADVTSLSASPDDLIVAGLNSSNIWVAISSSIELGSTLASGSVATLAAVNLNIYSAFTLAKKGITCAPVFVASGVLKTWNGTQWSPSGAPNDTNPAILTSSVFPGNFVCNTLEIGANNITLTDGQTIEVVNGITGSGVITMSSTASILQRNDDPLISKPNIALTKSTRSGMRAFDYIYWGSPLTENSFGQLGNAQAYNSTNTATSGNSGAFDLKYKYVSGDVGPNGGWKTLTETVPGSGFIMRMKNQAPFDVTISNSTNHINLTFSGAANNGTVTVPVVIVDGNPLSVRNNSLLSNPYPSAISIAKFFEFNSNNIDGVVYLWKASTLNTITDQIYNPSDYIAYTLAGSTALGSPTLLSGIFDGKIATGQGFKVKATSNGDVVFNNCMRVSGSNDQFLRTSNSTIDRYKLKMTGANGVGNQILVAYMPETTLAYDRMYDAELNSVSAAQIYSILDGTARQLAINARPTFENTDIVNLGISKSNTNTESFKVTIADKEGVFATNTVNVFLHDRLLNVYHNLADGGYTFTSNSTELNSRFQVVYQDAALSNTDFESNNVIATINNQSLKIVASLPITNVAIYDISGRLVTDIKVGNQLEVTNAFHFSEGIYIAKIKLENGAIATQKLINKK